MGKVVEFNDHGQVPLLAPDEPGPVELVNEQGPAPMVLLCDHASAFIPRALDGLGLDESQRARHIALDIGIAAVTRCLARDLDAPAVMSGFSRLIVDPNRTIEVPELIPEVADGVVVPGNRDLSAAQRALRLDTFYRPYHAAVAAAIAAKLSPGDGAGAGLGPAIVSMHSFTPVMDGFERPWQIGILWNRDPRMPAPMMAKLRARGITVGDNEPYSGRDHHGHTLHSQAEPLGLAHVLVEVRQDLIDTHQGAEEWAGVIRAVLHEILADPAIYKRQGPA